MLIWQTSLQRLVPAYGSGESSSGKRSLLPSIREVEELKRGSHHACSIPKCISLCSHLIVCNRLLHLCNVAMSELSIAGFRTKLRGSQATFVKYACIVDCGKENVEERLMCS